MAGSKHNDIYREKAALIARLDRARTDGARDLNGLALALDVPMQVRRALRTGAWKWLAAALAFGTAAGIALFPKRKSSRGNELTPAKSRKQAFLLSILAAAAQGALTLAKPAITKLVREQAEKFAKGLQNP